MIVIFDLDDTLYPERSFVESGFRSVAAMLGEEFDWGKEASLSEMLAILDDVGRGMVFDFFLKRKGRYSVGMVKKCVKCYRGHSPDITLYPEANVILDQGRGSRLYLVTDGNKCVQANKVKALNLGHLFHRIFITHRFGIRYAKPSTYCFELIKNLEKCKWSNMVYIGDNPHKDFVGLNKLGVTTIRVRTGHYRNDSVAPAYDAQTSIASLLDLPERLNWK